MFYILIISTFMPNAINVHTKWLDVCYFVEYWDARCSIVSDANSLSTYKVKRHFFDTAVGACADRDEIGSQLKNSDPPHPILIETRSYRRLSGRLQAVRCGQITYASLRFLGKCYSININASSLWRKGTSHQTTYPWNQTTYPWK